MNIKKNPKTASSKNNNRTAFRGGSYSLMITAIVFALVIAVNVLAGMLPPSMTQFDISASKLYSVTSNTKTVLHGLQDDVTIYWIVQSDKEDPILENLLNKYESLSDHITVTKKNPDIYPTFAQQYTDEEVMNNSLVVECGERSRYIGFDDIYLTEPDLPAQSVSASFDGEGAITSAIDYVVNEEQPKIYLLEGHGEPELPQGFADQISKSNMEIEKFSLLNVDEIPEDADCVMIYAPESDFAEQEVDMLHHYVQSGGRLFVAAGPTKSGSLPTLYSLLKNYGVTTAEGVVVESDRSRYAFRQPYVLIPDMASSPITDSLIEEHYFPIFPISQGMQIGTVPAGTVVTPLLSVPETAFNKADGYELTTYEQEEGDITGPFTLALNISTGSEGQIVWFSSCVFLDELYNAYSSGANLDLGMNALSSMIGESEAMAIRTKSLNYDYLTISESTATLLKVLMIGVFPLVYLGIGIAVVVNRRRKKI